MEILLKDESRGDAGAAGAVDATREAGRRQREHKVAAPITAVPTPNSGFDAAPTPTPELERGTSHFRHPNDGQPLPEAREEEQPLGRASRLGGYRNPNDGKPLSALLGALPTTAGGERDDILEQEPYEYEMPKVGRCRLTPG